MIPLFQNGEYKGSYEPGDKCKHRNSKPNGETCSEGCCDYYECKDCGKVFLVECPD